MLKEAFNQFGWIMPSSNSTITNIILNEALEKEKEISRLLKKKYQNGYRFTAVIDEWTSIANTRFMSVVLNDSEESFSLGIIKLNDSSTTENLRKAFLSHLDKFYLDISMIVAVVCDGANVMLKLQSTLESQTIICLAHGIHLAVCDTFVSKKTKNLLNKSP